MNKTILFIIDYLDYGGAGKMMKYVANICADHFDDISLLALYEKERSRSLSSKVKFYSLEESQTGGILWRYRLIKKIRNAIETIQPKVVCTFVSDICFSVRLATLGVKTTIVSAERGDPFTLPYAWKLLVGWTYRNSDYCFFQLSQARDFFGKKVAEKSFVIPNVFVQEDGLTPYWGKRKNTIVGAGRFVEEKRFEVLIEAFSRVSRVHPEFRLILYGEGKFLEKYKLLAEKLGISELIDFPGYVKGVARAIREDGIFVLPSRYEGIPNTLIEALSIGIPCVSTDCTPGGPFFLTKEGKNGILVPVDDVGAMEEAILKVIENDKISRTLSEKGPEIIEELKPSVIDKQWIEAFNFIIKKNINYGH